MATNFLRCGCTFSQDYRIRTKTCEEHIGFPETVSLGVELERTKSDMYEAMTDAIKQNAEFPKRKVG